MEVFNLVDMNVVLTSKGFVQYR